MLQDSIYVDIEFKESVKKMYCTCNTSKTYDATDYNSIDNMIDEIYKLISLDESKFDFTGFFGDSETYKTIARIYKTIENGETVYKFIDFSKTSNLSETYKIDEFTKKKFKECVKMVMYIRRNLELE